MTDLLPLVNLSEYTFLSKVPTILKVPLTSGKPWASVTFHIIAYILCSRISFDKHTYFLKIKRLLNNVLEVTRG